MPRITLAIRSPKNASDITFRKGIAVGGVCDPDVTSLQGTMKGTGIDVAGALIGIIPMRRQAGRRWMMWFPHDGNVGALTQVAIEVKGVHADDKHAISLRIKTGPPPDRAGIDKGDGLLELDFIGVSGPNDSDTVDGTTFVAFGSASHAVTSITMNAIAADFVFEGEPGGDGERFWAAMFPPLDPSSYTLLALDSANHSDAVTGLTVT